MSPAILPQVKTLDDPIPPSRSSSYTATISDSRSEAVCSKDADYDPYLIDSFEPGAPDNPQNWSDAQKWYLTLLSGMLVLNATFASSSPSGIFHQLREEFHLSQTLGTLTLSLFVCGYCVGPLLWGPLSEQYGRRPIFIFPFFVYACFMAGGALAKNTTSVLVFRFLGGTFAAAPLTNSGAMISDIWSAGMRGKALAVFTVAPFAGPALGPTAAGFIGTSVSWRWLFWVLAIFALVCEVFIIFTIPETYPPVLFVKKAQAKRLETGDNRYWAKLERQDVNFKQRAKKVLSQPFIVLFTEPMLMALTLYMSFVYGCLYILFTAYPIVFTQGHGFSPGVSGLMFLPIPIGGALAVILYIYYYNPRYERQGVICSPRSVPPEFRLEVSTWAGPLFTISFFWFAWTSFPHLSYWVPMLAGLLIGYSIQLIFLGLVNYIVDAYLPVAASALAGNTVVRSLFGAAFPLFGPNLYGALGPQWAASLVGFVSLLLIPIPFILQRCGSTLRRKSRFSASFDEEKEAPSQISESEKV
ncbi:hypothetical protein D9619_002999 [Psilocybe cf. subviscida]|uniref:Major facilitator superfamily (MFS) profile domain-containing protein n=1 Tax=Psilocybe cf. subviscida TaxID=2480587 RepID=A0A8H5EV85_9AGAR|nr:hypothetical protein D9619_002999 [Psilocybe cf. subviscida]